MKIMLQTIRINPNSIEEIVIEDVANFAVNDTKMTFSFNDGKTEEVFLRANDGQNTHEWTGFSIFGTRVGMKVDTTK